MPPWNDFPVLLRAEAYFFITLLFPLCTFNLLHNVKNGKRFSSYIRLLSFLFGVTAHVLFLQLSIILS